MQHFTDDSGKRNNSSTITRTYSCDDVVVVVFTLKTVLTSIQYPSLSYSQGKETNFRGHKLTQNKVQKNKIK